MWTDLRRHTPTPRRGSAGQERHLAAVSAVAHHLAVQRAPSDNLVGLGWTHLGSSVPAWGNLEKLQEDPDSIPVSAGNMYPSDHPPPFAFRISSQLSLS